MAVKRMGAEQGKTESLKDNLIETDSRIGLIDRLITDNSDREQRIIRFTLQCQVCGAVWNSRETWFRKPKGAPEIVETAWRLTWEKARQEAVKDALMPFNYCDDCNRISCDKCYRSCEDTDRCAECCERLGIKGVPMDIFADFYVSDPKYE